LTFTPAATGQRAATLTIADDAPNSPQAVSLNGAGTASPAPALTVAGTTSLTVKAGQTATYHLQIVPNFSGSIALRCSGAPLAATCTVPPTLQVTNGSAASFAVAVATTGAAMVPPVPSSPRIPPFAYLRLLPLLALAALLVLILDTQRMPRWTITGGRLAFAKVLAILVVNATLAGAGCGGGALSEHIAPVTQTPTTTPTTPQGTSTITVTPTPTVGGKQLTPLPAISRTLTVQQGGVQLWSNRI
jgi:hypothetical protein